MVVALSIAKLKSVPPGKQISERGLRFTHDKRGSKFFSYRTRISGKQYQWGCGAVEGSNFKGALEEALKRAESIKEQLSNGTPPDLIDRVSDRREALTPASSLRVVMEAFLATKRLEWTNEKHSVQWVSPINRYMPRLLANSVSAVGVDDVLSELTPVWTELPETASRIQQRLAQVFNYAIARGLRSHANPISREVIRAVLPAPRKLKPLVHHYALPFADLPAVYSGLIGSDSISAYLTRWLILTACRSGEGAGACWSEIDGDVWTIPADRMKARREHRVPITEEMRTILARMNEWREAHRSDLIFASPNKFQILTDVSVAKTLKRYSRPEATPHGLRSSFKDWSTEEGWDDYFSEQQLAHGDRNKVRSAYRRSDVFEGRRAMMRAWAGFLT